MPLCSGVAPSQLAFVDATGSGMICPLSAHCGHSPSVCFRPIADIRAFAVTCSLGGDALKDKLEYWPGMLVDLGALEDDLVANGAPVEAIRHVQEAGRICREQYRRAQADKPPQP